jgi:PTS system fructose-specific IIA component
MLINEELIVIPVEQKTKEGVIEALAEVALSVGRIADKAQYVAAVLKREEEYSTAVGFHVAIPHGKTDAVTEPFLMYGRVEKVDWNALDGEPVDHVFMIGVPEKEAGSTHLQILAKLSRRLMKEEFRSELTEATNAQAIIDVLKKNELL